MELKQLIRKMQQLKSELKYLKIDVVASEQTTLIGMELMQVMIEPLELMCE